MITGRGLVTTLFRAPARSAEGEETAVKHVQKVLLVNAGTDGDVSSIANDGTFPALGVVSLATVLLRDHPYLDVIALDGQITPMPEIDQLIRDFEPDVLGLSALGTSYLNTLRLAEAGKNAGAVTILGNDQAVAMARSDPGPPRERGLRVRR